MTVEVQNLSHDLKHLQTEKQQVPTLRAEIDGLHQELIGTRTAYAYEKKSNTEQSKQSQALEKILVSVAQELESPRTQLEKRARRTENFSPVHLNIDSFLDDRASKRVL